jgi:hypothetical protein
LFHLCRKQVPFIYFFFKICWDEDVSPSCKNCLPSQVFAWRMLQGVALYSPRDRRKLFPSRSRRVKT